MNSIPQSVPSAEPSATSLEGLAAEVVRDAIALLNKTELLLAEWEQRYRPTEPVLANLEDWVDLFVQSQQIRLPDDLFQEPAEHYYPADRKSATGSGSVVAEMTPAAMLAVIEAMPSLEQIQGLAHSESIDAWVAMVDQALTEPMGLRDLQVKTGLAIVPLWLALLFGEFAIGREGDFYEGAVFVLKRQAGLAY